MKRDETMSTVKMQPFATKLPLELTKALDSLCRRLGLRKNFVVETALREKIEDLLDAEDLRTALGEATTFHSWEKVKQEARSGKRR
jgi:predicted DNA-binding protein